ncbi:MAG: hypothetical protein AAFV95_01510 [Bacteroidota bacterium]
MPEDKEKGGNLFDRILKENVESIFIPLIKWQLGLQISSYKPLKDKITKTVERELDALYELHLEDGGQMLLHVDFQTRRDPTMLYRMAEYHGLVFKKYRLPIQHLVIYLGMGKFGGNQQLQQKEIFQGFELLNLYELDVERLLTQESPQAVILALLADFKGRSTEVVLRAIILRLKTICHSNSELRKYLTQLTILSRLRKLEDVVPKMINSMPIHYDIETDGLYIRGMKKGLAKGMEKEIENSRIRAEEKERSIIISLLQSGLLSPEQISEHLQVPLERVLDIQRELEE